MKKKILLSSVLTIALCFCLILGSTYALFTSGADFDIAVTAGKVEISATINDDLQVKSLEDEEFSAGKVFSNGGTVSINEGELVIDKMTPGDEVKFTVDVTNSSNVAVMYRINAVSTIGDNADKKDLSEVLTYTVVIDGTPVTMTQNAEDPTKAASAWISVDAGVVIGSLEVIAAFPNGTPEHDNPYQEATAKIAFTLEAVQANGVDVNGNLILPETTNP